jgi:O-acetyl-ADP-ribose deacetylase (regulator of RNase III)
MGIELFQGDITTLAVDAIVNAANETLLGGGGVDGAIHRAAGPELLKECRALNGCKKGEAKITKGYNLPAKYVIHTVGPVYGRENGKEQEILTSCYLNSFKLAKEHKIRTIAFPAISTGAYGYPIEKSAKIAISSALYFDAENCDFFDRLIFVLYTEPAYKIYRSVFEGKEEYSGNGKNPKA